jgi:uncharacterized delta-60 repeat protein
MGTGGDAGYSLALTLDEKIVVAGYSDTASNGTDFAVVRYLSNGSLDPAFNSTGKVLVDIGGAGHDDYCYNVAVQADGKVVMTGVRYTTTTAYDLVIVRLNENGSLDTTLNGSGMVVSAIGSGNSTGGDVAVQPDGKIVVVGDAVGPSNVDFLIARYNVDGTFDTTFRNTGKVLTDFGSGDDFAYEVSLQADGKILVVGRAGDGSASGFGVARYLSNGVFDPSFGSGGTTATQFGPGFDIASSVAIQGDGRFVAAGGTYNGANYDFAIARYFGSASPGKILAGPVLNPANGNAYFLLSQDTWPASEARAQALGGHLVTINDAAENQFVFDTFGPIALAQHATGPKSLWLGYTDVEFEGSFFWVNGENPGYTNWVPGQPQGSAPAEDFAGIALNLLTPGRWHDILGNSEASDVTYGVVEVTPLQPTGNSGKPVPGETDLVFAEFGPPAIDNGNIGCVASVKPTGGGKPQIVIYGDTNGFVLARTGGPVGNGENYLSLGDPAFGGEALGFTAITQLGSTSILPFLGFERFGFADLTRALRARSAPRLAGLFSRVSRVAGIKPVARQNGNAPGTNATFSKLPSFGLPRSRPGIVFTGKLKRGGGVTAKNDFGVWRETAAGGDSEKLLRTDEDINLVGGGTEHIAKLEIMIPVAMQSDQRRSFAPDGTVIAAAKLADGSPAVVRVAPNGDKTIDLRRNSSVPGLPGAVWESFSAPAARSGGNYALFARVLAGVAGVSRTNNDGIFATSGGNLRGIVRRGDPLPTNTNQRFSRLGHPAMGQSGLVAFFASLSGRGVTPANRSVLVASRDTNTKVTVARLGEAAPDTGPGVVFRSFKAMVVTDTAAGQIVFIATIKGPGVTARNNVGLWSTSSTTGEVKLLLRSGQVTRVGNTAPVVRSLGSLTATTATAGQGRSTDTAGFVTARVRLSDGRAGVLRIPLP